jgi:hypothetical protein
LNGFVTQCIEDNKLDQIPSDFTNSFISSLMNMITGGREREKKTVASKQMKDYVSHAADYHTATFKKLLSNITDYHKPTFCGSLRVKQAVCLTTCVSNTLNNNFKNAFLRISRFKLRSILADAGYAKKCVAPVVTILKKHLEDRKDMQVKDDSTEPDDFLASSTGTRPTSTTAACSTSSTVVSPTAASSAAASSSTIS